MTRFTLPRDIYHGKGALEALKDFNGKRAVVCVGAQSGTGPLSGPTTGSQAARKRGPAWGCHTQSR